MKGRITATVALVVVASIVAVVIAACTGGPPPVVEKAAAQDESSECSGVAVDPSDSLPALAQRTPPGATFCLSDGTYRVRDPIEVDDADVWMGVYDDGRRPTIVANKSPSVFDANASTGATIRGITASGADGDSSCQPSCGRGISGGTDLTLDNVRSTNNANQGSGGTGSGLLVKDSVFDNNGSRPFYEDGTYASAAGLKTVNSAIILNSRAEDNAWAGFWCDLECNAFEVRDSVVIANGKAGIFYEVSTGPAVFTGNVVLSNGHADYAASRSPSGILVSSSQNADIYANTFSGNYGASVKVKDDDREPVVDNIRIHENVQNGDPYVGCTIPGVTCE